MVVKTTSISTFPGLPWTIHVIMAVKLAAEEGGKAYDTCKGTSHTSIGANCPRMSRTVLDLRALSLSP